MTVCIYHFSANPNSPACKKDVKRLLDFAKDHGYENCQVFLDGTLKTGAQVQFDSMLETVKDDTNNPCIFLMDLYHFNKWIQKAISEADELCQKGVRIITIRDGEIKIDEALSQLKEPRKAAFYFSNLTGIKDRTMETQLRIAEVFCQEKTNWMITGIYYDSANVRGVKSQPELEKLIKDADNYDVLIVGSLQQIDLRTARFIKLRNQLNLDIYSMQDGMLYKKGGD